MAWNDEIQEAAYNSPSGKRQTFIYENVSRETDLKTASFVFPELDGALIQSLGLGGRTFPLKCIFSGASCNKEADSFEKLLSERGHGILEHPVYGKINVVPTGKIKRTDNILDGANESSVEVTFSETLVEEESTSEVATVDKLDAAMDEYENSAAANFSNNIYTDSIEDKMQLQAAMKSNANSTFKGVEKMIKAAPKNKKRANLFQWYDSAKRFINSIIDNVDKIGTFANEVATTTIKMIRLPSQITSDAFSKLAGYQLMIKDIANNVKADPFGTKAVTNQWAAATLAWGSMVAALSYGCAKTAAEQSVNQGANNFESSGDSAEDDSDFSEGSANGGFTSRSDVLETAAQIAASFAEYSAYIDSQNKKNAFVDTGETYEKLLNVVTYSLRSLEETAFDLPVTRIIKLDRDRQLFELLTELYGKDGFNRQDQFINDNKLTADEIVLIPMGREVRYYA